MPVVAGILVAQFDVEKVLCIWCRILSVVGKVIALRLTACVCHRQISFVSAIVIADARLGIHEIVAFVDVQYLVCVASIFQCIELIVLSIGFVVHIAILHVGKQIPIVAQMVGCLCEKAVIVLVTVRVVVLQTSKVLHLTFVCNVCQIAEVVATELL